MKRETGKKRRRDTNRMVEEEFLNIEEIKKKMEKKFLALQVITKF